MKRFALLVALLGSTTFVSMANTGHSTKPISAKVSFIRPLQEYLVHFTLCGADTYLIASSYEEAREGSFALYEYYCIWKAA